MNHFIENRSWNNESLCFSTNNSPWKMHNRRHFNLATLRLYKILLSNSFATSGTCIIALQFSLAKLALDKSFRSLFYMYRNVVFRHVYNPISEFSYT